MLVSGIKSRPLYGDTLALDPKGARHLLIASGADALPVVAAALAAGDAASDPGQAPVLLLLDAASGPFIPPAGGPQVTVETYADPAACLDRVTGLLDAATMGIRVYAVGPEQFVWTVAIAAEPFGFGKGEVVQVIAGSIARKVFCTHCRTLNEDVTDNIHACTGCGCRLLVRDHFSRRLGAFMAVKVDSEVPGEDFAVEELFP